MRSILSLGLSRRRPLCGAAFLLLAGALFVFTQAAGAHGGLDEQIARMSALIVRSPADPDLLVKRGELYRAARQYPQALADLDRATRLRRPLPAADLVRAHVLLDMGQALGAADAASRFLAAKPADPGALVIRARAHARLGRTREAAIDFSRALDARAVPDWYIERARLIDASDGREVEAALRGLDTGIRRLGPLVTLELEAIDLEVRLGRYDAALARLDRVMAQAARKDTFLARRGAILEASGRTAQARAAYEAALAAAQSLPPWTQRTAAATALIKRVRTAVARLSTRSQALNQR